MRRTTAILITLLATCFLGQAPRALANDYDNTSTIGPAKGWLVIQGGGAVTNEVKERFVALAGGPNANFVVIPTARPSTEIDLDKRRQSFSNGFLVTHVTVLHTRDRVRANSEGFVEPLRHASGVWIDGGRQWRLADAYLGTAVEREIKALLARGGVVCGGSAGATIQGSFLVRGTPGNASNPDGDNRIMMSPGHEAGFGLLANSAIDQHVDARGREGDLDPVISEHPNLLGIGIDQSAAIVVHGDSFFVVGGQVVIHDGKDHDGAPYYFLSSGQEFNLKTRSLGTTYARQAVNYPLSLVVTTASRTANQRPMKAVGVGVLDSKEGSSSESKRINFECNVSLYSVGNHIYPVRISGSHQLNILAREVDSDELREFACESESILDSTATSVGDASQISRYPLTLTVTRAQRYYRNGWQMTNGAGLLASKDDPAKKEQVILECDTGVFSRAGNNRYLARINKPHQLKIAAREIGSDKVHEATCKY
jgi:cyanophycinase